VTLGSSAAAGALAVLVLALVGAAVFLPRQRLALVGSASAAAGALITLLLLGRLKTREEVPKPREEPRQEKDSVELRMDPTIELREELREEAQRIEGWTEDELRDRLGDYDARANKRERE